MKQHGNAVAPQRLDRQLQQVHRLRAGKDTAAAEDGISAEKAAHGGKRQVSVKVNLGIFDQLTRLLPQQMNRHKYTTYYFFCKRNIS